MGLMRVIKNVQTQTTLHTGYNFGMEGIKENILTYIIALITVFYSKAVVTWRAEVGFFEGIALKPKWVSEYKWVPDNVFTAIKSF
jgi:hypothetical protein